MEKRRWKWILVVIIIAAVGGANIYLVKANEEKKLNLKTITMDSIQMNDSIIATGSVNYADQREFYYNPAKGSSISLSVTEGQQILKGKQLFTYSDSSVSSQIEQASLENEKILVLLEKYNQKIKELEKELKNAKEDNIEKQAIEQIEEQLTETKYERRISNVDYNINKERLRELKVKESDLTVISSIDGKVSKINEDVLTQETVAPYITVASNQPYQIYCELSEYEVMDLKKGQVVKIKSKANPTEELRGKVLEVETQPIQKQYEQEENTTYYLVKISVPDDAKLGLGSHADLEIEVVSNRPTPAILATAIFKEDKENFVILKKDGTLIKQKIEIGNRNAEYVEVIEGIGKSDKVVANATKDVIEEAS